MMMNRLQTTSDSELLHQSKAGSCEAFNELIERYTGSVYGVAWAHLHDAESAEELTQEVFLRAWLKLADLRDASRFAPWLLRMARNMAISWLRKKQSRSTLIQLVPMDETVEATIKEPEKSASEKLQYSEEQEALKSALAKLSEAERELICLHYMESLTQRELGERLQVHHTTVSRKLEKALRVLKGFFVEEVKLPPASPKLKKRARLLIAATATLSPQVMQQLQASAAASATTAEGAKVAVVSASVVSSFLSTSSSAISTGVLAMTAAQKFAAIAAVVIIGAGSWHVISSGNTAQGSNGSESRLRAEGAAPEKIDRTQTCSFFGEQVFEIPTGQAWQLNLSQPNPENMENVILVANPNQTLSLFGNSKDGNFSLTIDPQKPDSDATLASYQIWPERNLLYVIAAATEATPTGMRFHLFAKNKPELLPEAEKINAAFREGRISKKEQANSLSALLIKNDMIPTAELNRQQILKIMNRELMQ